jgi:hypothetical protein
VILRVLRVARLKAVPHILQTNFLGGLLSILCHFSIKTTDNPQLSELSVFFIVH